MEHEAARILIVDDDPFNLDLLEYEIQGAGHETRLASNANQAWKVILEGWPEICLLDVMMPGITGLELTRRIRADPGYNSLPIILLTARGELGDKSEGFASGAQDYVVKPFESAEVLARVAIQLRIRRLQDRVREKASTQAWVAMVGTAAHQLSQPLAGASGYLQLLEASRAADEPGEERERRLDQIGKSLDRALLLMGKMADLRRFRTEPYACHLSIVDLEASSGAKGETPARPPRLAFVDRVSEEGPPGLTPLREAGWELRPVHGAEELKRLDPDIVVLHQVPASDLGQWVESIQALGPPPPASLLIASGSHIGEIADLLASGVDDVLVRPFHNEELRMRLRTRAALRALQRQDLESESLQQARKVSLRTIDDCEPHIRGGRKLLEDMRREEASLRPLIRRMSALLDQLNLAIRSLQVRQQHLEGREA